MPEPTSFTAPIAPSGPTGPIALEAQGIHKTYRSAGREAPAVRGIDLDVERGEWVAVMGPSGCGKSTLLHLLGGLDRPDRGEVRLAGQRMENLNESQRAVLRRRHLGYVFQFFNLVPTLTVAGNVELPLVLQGRRRSAARTAARDLLVELGLADELHAAPAELSGGQQQRVALARALVHRPDVLLADEPTGSLDTDSARGVMELLRRRHDEGQTIVMVTHDPRVAAAADRVLVMIDGRFSDERRLHDDLVTPVLSHLVPLEVG
jgi:putative ABC transport system ATP-binding protein